MWKRSLKDEILAPIDRTEKNYLNVYLAAFIILCINQTDTFEMLYSDCAIFDRNSNKTKILANEANFANLISFYENDLST